MAILTKDQILNSSDLVKEKVSVPEWGGDVYVRMMTGTERDRFEEKIFNATEKNQGFSDTRAMLVALTMVDANGNRIFDDSDIKELGKKSASALNRLFSTAQRLNAFSDDDIAELEKN